MKKIILITLILVLTFTSNTFALFGIFDDVIESNTPQPMYRVTGGQEIEYMLKEQIKERIMRSLREDILSLEEQNIDQSALMSVMLGNNNLTNIVGDDFSNYSQRDWEDIIYNKIENLFSQLNNTVDETAKLPEDKAEEVEKEVEDRIIDPVDTVITDLQSQYKDNNIPVYTREEREKLYKEKIEELNKRLDITVNYYANIDKKYGNNSEYQNYINKERKSLNNISKELEENLDNATLPMIMKSLNVLLIQNNRIQLNTLKAISDLNEQIGRIGEQYQKYNIGEEFKKIDRRFNR